MQSKQSELFKNAVTGSALWFYKEGEQGRMTTSEPRVCRGSINRDNCGLFLNSINNFEDLMGEIDGHVSRNDPNRAECKYIEDNGEYKFFLVVSATQSNTTGKVASTFKSRIMHTDILVLQQVNQTGQLLGYIIGFCDEGIYIEVFDQDYELKIYGLIYLGFIADLNHYKYTPSALPKILKIILNESILPPNQYVKLVKKKKHPYSRWSEDTYTDGSGVLKNFCDNDEDLPLTTLEDIFIKGSYNVYNLNCQTFCKAFISILRCNSHESCGSIDVLHWNKYPATRIRNSGAIWAFIPFQHSGNTNLKLDITQLSALKKITSRKHRQTVLEPEPEDEQGPEPEDEIEPEPETDYEFSPLLPERRRRVEQVKEDLRTKGEFAAAKPRKSKKKKRKSKRIKRKSKRKKEKK